MEEPSYKFNKVDDSLTFEFDSVSSTKTIKKLIQYSLINERASLYNLALLDVLPNGTISDLSVSNNLDMPMVLSTVFQSIIYFFEKKPDSNIYSGKYYSQDETLSNGDSKIFRRNITEIQYFRLYWYKNRTF